MADGIMADRRNGAFIIRKRARLSGCGTGTRTVPAMTAHAPYVRYGKLIDQSLETTETKAMAQPPPPPPETRVEYTEPTLFLHAMESFEGQVVDGLPEGFGKALFVGGATYEVCCWRTIL